MIQTESKIKSCTTSGCDWKCCQFNAGNYIVMQPGELRRAQLSGISTNHLKVIEADYHSGQKVVCNAKNTATCDGGLKPKDCQYYPAYPAVDKDGEVTHYIRGKKCPLKNGNLDEHLEKVEADLKDQIQKKPSLKAFFAKIKMVGYEPPRALPSSNQNFAFPRAVNA